MKRSVNQILSPILVLFGLLFMLGSYLLPKYPLVPVDADVVPLFLGGLFALLGVLLFFVKDDQDSIEALSAKIKGEELGEDASLQQERVSEAKDESNIGENKADKNTADKNKADKPQTMLLGLPLETGQILLFGGAIILYIALLESIGFFIMTALFIFSTTALLGYKHYFRNALVALGVPLFFYLTFTQLLKISLPSGILPF